MMILCLFLSEYYFYSNIINILTFKVTKLVNVYLKNLSLSIPPDPPTYYFLGSHRKSLLCVLSHHLCICMSVSTDDYYTMFLFIQATLMSRYKSVQLQCGNAFDRS